MKLRLFTIPGAYPIAEYPQLLIDISGISELKGFVLDQNLVLGAGTTLSEALDIFKSLSSQKQNFSYLEKLHDHIQLVAHIPVRNVSCSLVKSIQIFLLDVSKSLILVSRLAPLPAI